jgi:hypothetical protein
METHKPKWDGKIYEWRCTRNQPYMDKGCTGFKDTGARQGHYVRARTWDAAIWEMKKKFPNDTEGFTATRWKEFDPDDLPHRPYIVTVTRVQSYRVMAASEDHAIDAKDDGEDLGEETVEMDAEEEVDE